MSYFTKTEELLRRLIDDADTIYPNLADIQSWDGQLFETYLMVASDLRFLENRAIKYRKNMIAQARDPDLKLYGIQMCKRLEKFLDRLDTIWTAWSEQIEPICKDHVQKYIDMKNEQAQRAEGEKRKQMEEAIIAGRSQTEAEAQTRERLRVELIEKSKEDDDLRLRNTAKEAERKQFATRLNDWVESVATHIARYENSGFDYCINLALNVMIADVKIPERSIPDCLVNVRNLFGSIYKTPGNEDGGLSFRLLREGNTTFKGHFPYIWGVRVLLIGAGYRPYIGVDGIVELSSELRSIDDQYGARLSEIKSRGICLDTTVFWFLAEPSITDYAEWIKWRTNFLNMSRCVDNYVAAINENLENAEYTKEDIKSTLEGEDNQVSESETEPKYTGFELNRIFKLQDIGRIQFIEGDDSGIVLPSSLKRDQKLHNL